MSHRPEVSIAWCCSDYPVSPGFSPKTLLVICLEIWLHSQGGHVPWVMKCGPLSSLQTHKSISQDISPPLSPWKTGSLKERFVVNCLWHSKHSCQTQCSANQRDSTTNIYWLALQWGSKLESHRRQPDQWKIIAHSSVNLDMRRPPRSTIKKMTKSLWSSTASSCIDLLV